jgi:hypothetical protein
MRTLIPTPPSWQAAVLAASALALCCACRPLTDAWMSGWTEARANDRIMLVRAEPRTFGYQRLVNQSGVYPDLEAFLHLRGTPDFLAESTASNRHFLILYYLDDRTAFACRAREPRTRFIEFAGPYSITDREYQVLSELKAKNQESAERP